MQLSNDEIVTFLYLEFERAFTRGDMSRAVYLVPDLEQIGSFLVLYVIRVQSTYTDPQTISQWVVPRMVELAEHVFSFWNKRLSLQILFWVMTFCDMHDIPGRARVVAVLNVQLADVLHQYDDAGLDALITLIKNLFHKKEVIYGLPEALMLRAANEEDGVLKCAMVAFALFKSKEHYKLGRGHLQLAENLFVRALCSATEDSICRPLQDNLDIVRFLLHIWDVEAGNTTRALYSERRRQQALFLRNMLQ